MRRVAEGNRNGEAAARWWQYAGKVTDTSKAQTGRDAGLSKRQKDAAMSVASLPDEDCEAVVEGVFLILIIPADQRMMLSLFAAKKC